MRFETTTTPAQEATLRLNTMRHAIKGLSETQWAVLEWLGDDSVEYGNPGNLLSINALGKRGLAMRVDGRWTATETGRLALTSR